MHHQIDSLAYTNRIRYLPPKQKFSLAIILFILGYIGTIPIQISITIWLTVWIVVYARIPAATYFKLQTIPFSFFLTSLPALIISIGFVDNISSFHSDILQGFNLNFIYIYISRQGIQQASELITRSIAVTSCMSFILLTIPFVEIIRILQQLRCPSLVIELLSLMYRFIFVLAETAIELVEAQKSRLGYRTWETSMRSVGLIISQLLKRTLDNYRQISMGLISRGFNGELRVWYSRRHKTNLRYLLEGIGGCLILIIYTGFDYVNGI